MSRVGNQTVLIKDAVIVKDLPLSGPAKLGASPAASPGRVSSVDPLDPLFTLD